MDRTDLPLTVRTYVTDRRTRTTRLILLFALATLASLAFAQDRGEVMGFNPVTGKPGEPMRPPLYDSPTGLPAPKIGEQVTATPEYVVNFLAVMLELRAAPCSIEGVTILLCGETYGEAHSTEVLFDTFFELFLQPSTRSMGWQTDGASGARIAMFQRPEGTYGLSVTDGAATIAYLGP